MAGLPRSVAHAMSHCSRHTDYTVGNSQETAMDRTERFYKIQQILQKGRAVPRQKFLDLLEVSPATFKRDLEYMRDRMGAPIVWDREARGYRFDTSDPQAADWELPGLWFSEEELRALLTVEHLLENIQPGLLGAQITPLRDKIRQILGRGDHSADEVIRRIRVLPMASRRMDPGRFETIAAGLLSRRRLKLAHFRRQVGETVERVVSPQRLVHYRDNWYLDAWCHLRDALRCFSVDAVAGVSVLDDPARVVSDELLDKDLAAGYGIFGGSDTKTAVLKFDPVRSRWVSRETWHPQQKGRFEADGSWILEVPYSDPRELVMDILKYGADVEVLRPVALRRLVRENILEAASLYPK
jgi:predicted DNA-binding transcriptional regulator YafY